jgi:hypothetical protein
LKKSTVTLAYNYLQENPFMREKRRSSLRHGTRVNSNNGLVGAWEQEPNPGGTTSVVYTILIEQGKFVVSGMDGEDGASLEVSRIKWDGKSLRFTTVFPPTGHKSKHVVRALPKGVMSHHVSCVYADGEAFSDDEIWRRRIDKKKKSNPQQRDNVVTPGQRRNRRS